MGDLETPDWLNDLGPKPVKQSSIEDVPDWLHGTSTKSAQPEPAAPQDSSFDSGSSVDLPDWLASLDKEEAAAPLSAAPSDDVPLWLKSEIEPEPDVIEKARPADWQPVETKQPIEEPEVPEPVAEVEAPALPEKPVQKIEQRKIEQPRPAASVKVVSPKPTSAPSKSVPSSPAPSTLGNAQTELGRGNIAASLDIYSKLIRKGKSLEEIIRDLRDALYRYPVEVAIWQALGDAYMRANLLQEALDAYTKAEELLR
jgi:tetratricopeptide (TPR) repeat protein